MQLNLKNPTLGIFLPPSPIGPGMIKSPPLDIANLIAVLKSNVKCDINLFDFRIHIINKDSFCEKNTINVDLFNDFKGCFKHILEKENPKLTLTCKRILKELPYRDITHMIFSIAVLEQFSLQYLVSSLCIAKELKKVRPKLKIIFFGNCPKTHARKIMKNFSFLDSFLEDGNEFSVLEYIKKADRTKAINGIIYRDRNKLIYSNQSRPLVLNTYPLPDFSLFDLRSYQHNGKLVLPYELSRGCVNKCFFCYYIHKGDINCKSITKVINDLKKLTKLYKTNYFHFMDAAINFDPKYLRKLCHAFSKELPHIKWSALSIPNIDYDTLTQMKKSGCLQLRWGVEYASSRMLKIINKKTTPAGIRKVLGDSHKLGILNYITLLTGLNSETQKDIALTKEFIEEMSPCVDSAMECVWGELGHFSLLRLEKILGNGKKNVKAKVAQTKYAAVLEKLQIPCDDIIETITLDASVSLIITPEDFPSQEPAESCGRSLLTITSIISYLKCRGIEDIDYKNFFLLFKKNSALRNAFENTKTIEDKDKIKLAVKSMLKFVKKSKYFVFDILWWRRNIKTSLLLAQVLKKRMPQAKIIFLGPYCNLYYENILEEFKFIDFIITSEPEIALGEIISGKKPQEEIPNLIHRMTDHLCIHKEKETDLENLDCFLDYSLHSDFIKKFKITTPKVLDYEASRGCRNNCFFCSPLTDKKTRFKKIPFIIRDIKQITKTSKIKNMYFWDDALNTDGNFLDKLLSGIIDSKIKINWSSYMIPKNLSGGTIEKIAAAGCRHLRWGIESANPQRQKTIAKNVDLTQAHQILKCSSKYGISNQISFIVGFPHECLQDIHLIFDFLGKNHQYIKCANVYSFKPRRNTPAYNKSAKYGIKILSSQDKGLWDEVPFDETEGVDWFLKKKQQILYKNMVEEKIQQLGLLNEDPQCYFTQLVKNA